MRMRTGRARCVNVERNFICTVRSAARRWKLTPRRKFALETAGESLATSGGGLGL
jgi:hypothetical protein